MDTVTGFLYPVVAWGVHDDGTIPALIVRDGGLELVLDGPACRYEFRAGSVPE
jgi:hypothetical protein